MSLGRCRREKRVCSRLEMGPYFFGGALMRNCRSLAKHYVGAFYYGAQLLTCFKPLCCASCCPCATHRSRERPGPARLSCVCNCSFRYVNGALDRSVIMSWRWRTERGGRGEGGGWGGTQFVNGGCRMTMDPRIPTMPGGGGWGEGRVVAFPRFLVCVFPCAS